LALITKEGRNVLFGRIILVLGILGTILGGTYLGALEFRAFAEEAGIIDPIRALYYMFGIPILAIIALVAGAAVLIFSILEEKEGDVWLRSLLSHHDFSFYKGLLSLPGGFLFFMVLFGIPFLFLGKVVWRIGLLDFLSGGVVILLLTTSFCILGNLLMGLLVMSIPPRQQKRVLVGLAGFIAILLVGLALFVNREILSARFLDIVSDPYVPTAWGIELLFLVKAEGWLAEESLMRLSWLIGLALAGGVALHWVWPLTYRRGKGPKEDYDAGASLPVRWDSRFATLLGRLPLEQSTRAFLKKELILFLRHSPSLVRAIITIGAIFALSLAVEVPVMFLFVLYLMPIEFVSDYLHPSLKTEGGNMDYMKMLLDKGKFIATKIVTTFLMVLSMSLIIALLGFAISPAIEWELVPVVVRTLILTMAVLQATLVGMVLGEQILISGKESLDQQIVIRYGCGILIAWGWLLIDLRFLYPQMLPTWAMAMPPHLPLIIFGAVISYCLFRLRKFARAIEDI
jgi:hypothetical protein